jgi:aspartyl-tRNA(Asn)/glutamyl-tRNA(Gln) amidotransferase subunit C
VADGWGKPLRHAKLTLGLSNSALPVTLTETDVVRIAALARLNVAPADRAALARELSSIIDWMASLSSVDTGGVEPLAHPLELTARLRPDVVTEQEQREELLRIAPRVEAHLFLVPKVIE